MPSRGKGSVSQRSLLVRWPKLKEDTVDIDKVIDLHRVLWQDGGGVISYENLFKAQEIVDNYLLDQVNLGKVTVHQNLDGRIISVQRRAVKES
jgi:hypothetical protein